MLAPPQVEAVAAALELSGERFVWCVRGPGVGEEKKVAVPEGFEERVKGRGVVVEGRLGKAAVLKHRAVAGFLTHCGWRSVMEGMAAGVKMLMWPMGAEQYVNARLVVEVGMGVGVCEGEDGVPNVEEMAKKLKEMVEMKGEKGKEIRRMAAAAAEEGGSSSDDLERMVKELCMMGRRGT
ncbi:hypothetical protein J5N97_026476 [Dioscorea zingiberensis]|uniref:Uncharacterized protein n=1 Tax=Dioscorea zingiberensis TaxID=325984 RepID=A0A9D5C3B1_9LILI|nr:hypothetical protein J5N97_026476 [Dioscorea zingiberensis]